MTGIVRARPDGMVNPSSATGEIEVAATGLEVLSESETPPFPIEDRAEADEDLRLKYRYLDLRRPEMTQMLRSGIASMRMIREHLDGRGFVDIETPMLDAAHARGRARLPGARAAVPRRVLRAAAVAAAAEAAPDGGAGQDRYYQIVRCLRDEASRADRGFEFTQLDLEMSFVDEEDIFALMEPLFARLVREIARRGGRHAVPAPALRRDDGSVRIRQAGPPLRDGAGRPRRRCSPGRGSTRSHGAGSRRRDQGIAAPGGAQLSRKELDQLVDEARAAERPASCGWSSRRAACARRSRSTCRRRRSPASLEATGATAGDLVLIVADRADRWPCALDGLRRTHGRPAGADPRGRVA